MTQATATTVTARPAPAALRTALGRALLGTLVMAFALGTAGALGELAHLRLGVDGTARLALTAVLCGGIAVPLVLLLRLRADRLPAAGLGLTGPARSLRSFGLGLLVTGGSAAALLALGTAAGWLRWGPLDAPRLLTYLAVNALIALALEAVPEELALRGYVYGSLNARLRRWTAFGCTTLLFMAVPALSNAVQCAVTALLGGPLRSPGLVPPGEDPFAYLFLMAVFGFALLIARAATGSLWTGIALHLTFLTVNRVTFFGRQRGAGWSAEILSPDAALLVPAYLLLAAAVLVVLARLRGRRIGWRDRAPERPAPLTPGRSPAPPRTA